jgi:DNA polymerase-3 subunit beta
MDASKKQGFIISIGTDGNHLACLQTPYNNQPFKIVLNIQILKQINEFLTSGNTTWFIKNKNLGLQFNSVTLLIRTTEGEYPDLTKPLQTTLPNKITTNTHNLLNAVEKATLLTSSDKKPAVQMSIDKDVLKITARSIEYGSTFEEITITNPSTSACVSFALNSRYLINLLKNIDSTNVVIEFSSNNKPIFIKEENNSNYTSLILPIISF